ncbi:MAG: hypothetical protein GX613_10610 [Chloroflexi bacterium]|nr:hypothetical protein [Chloroflexota bacterium]
MLTIPALPFDVLRLREPIVVDWLAQERFRITDMGDISLWDGLCSLE